MGSLHNQVAVLVPDEKLLVLIFDRQFFFQNKMRHLSSGTSTTTQRMMAPHSIQRILQLRVIIPMSQKCRQAHKRNSNQTGLRLPQPVILTKSSGFFWHLQFLHHKNLFNLKPILGGKVSSFIKLVTHLLLSYFFVSFQILSCKSSSKTIVLIRYSTPQLRTGWFCF